MPLGGSLVSSLGSIGGGLIGAFAGGSKGTDAATNAQNAALAKWLSINVPDPAQQQIELQNYKVSGQLSPNLQRAFQQSPSNLQNMQVSPAARAAEIQALTQMQNVASSGGMDAEARLANQQAINSANANERGQRGAILQNYAARGMGGAGAELAAQLQASQGDANAASMQGMQAASGGEQRALNAMSGAGNLSGNLNTQDFYQAQQKAQAQDAINRFNTQNQNTAENANVNSQNKAQEFNLNNAQDVANKNTGVANQQEMYNQGLLQKQFDNQLKLAQGAQTGYNAVAGQQNSNQANSSKQWGGIGQAISQGGTILGQNLGSSGDSSGSGSGGSGFSGGYTMPDTGGEDFTMPDFGSSW